MADKPKHPGGRPSKYKPEYCERVIEMGKQGKSMVQWAAELGVAKSSIGDWAEVHPEFSEAVKIARTYSEAWYVTDAQANLTNNKYNSPLWIRMMINLHNWVSDKQPEVTETPQGIHCADVEKDKT